jgi:hypothetical protein
MQQSDPSVQQIRGLILSPLLSLPHPAFGKGGERIPKSHSLLDVVIWSREVDHEGRQSVLQSRLSTQHNLLKAMILKIGHWAFRLYCIKAYCLRM